jgi:predicted amidophosphoribosyltransferase
MKKCPHCAAKNDAWKLFCWNCGHKFLVSDLEGADKLLAVADACDWPVTNPNGRDTHNA